MWQEQLSSLHLAVTTYLFDLIYLNTKLLYIVNLPNIFLKVARLGNTHSFHISRVDSSVPTLTIPSSTRANGSAMLLGEEATIVCAIMIHRPL